MSNAASVRSRSVRDLASARLAFERWRSRSDRRRAIPEPLWRAAAELAREHGVSKTSRELRLDYYALARRVSPDPSPVAAGRFVEVALPALGGPPTGRLELEDGRGVRLRIELTGAAVNGLESIARALWSPTR